MSLYNTLCLTLFVITWIWHHNLWFFKWLSRGCFSSYLEAEVFKKCYGEPEDEMMTSSFTWWNLMNGPADIIQRMWHHKTYVGMKTLTRRCLNDLSVDPILGMKYCKHWDIFFKKKDMLKLYERPSLYNLWNVTPENLWSCKALHRGCLNCLWFVPVEWSI